MTRYDQTKTADTAIISSVHPPEDAQEQAQDLHCQY